MALIGEELATDAMLDKVLCICSGYRPIKTCPEGFADKCPSRSVVPTKSGKDFSQELPPFLFGDASLEHSSGTFLVELSLMDFVGLGMPYNTTCFTFGPREVHA